MCEEKGRGVCEVRSSGWTGHLVVGMEFRSLGRLMARWLSSTPFDASFQAQKSVEAVSSSATHRSGALYQNQVGLLRKVYETTGISAWHMTSRKTSDGAGNARTQGRKGRRLSVGSIGG